jgi:hypothetical protein
VPRRYKNPPSPAGFFSSGWRWGRAEGRSLRFSRSVSPRLSQRFRPRFSLRFFLRFFPSLSCRFSVPVLLDFPAQPFPPSAHVQAVCGLPPTAPRKSTQKRVRIAFVRRCDNAFGPGLARRNRYAWGRVRGGAAICCDLGVRRNGYAPSRFCLPMQMGQRPRVDLSRAIFRHTGYPRRNEYASRAAHVYVSSHATPAQKRVRGLTGLARRNRYAMQRTDSGPGLFSYRYTSSARRTGYAWIWKPISRRGSKVGACLGQAHAYTWAPIST